jgi:hypothetical protein
LSMVLSARLLGADICALMVIMNGELISDAMVCSQ